MASRRNRNESAEVKRYNTAAIEDGDLPVPTPGRLDKAIEDTEALTDAVLNPFDDTEYDVKNIINVLRAMGQWMNYLCKRARHFALAESEGEHTKEERDEILKKASPLKKKLVKNLALAMILGDGHREEDGGELLRKSAKNDALLFADTIDRELKKLPDGRDLEEAIIGYADAVARLY